jgi:tRNA-splicing ligase RtcB
VSQGFGIPEDLEHIEEGGCIEGARPDLVSARALERGKDQLGTLGSGNHFAEVGYVETIYDSKAAGALGLFDQQVTVMVHTGSRGLGHQVCDDAIKKLIPATAKYCIELPDRQLCCAPLTSPEGGISGGHAAANLLPTGRLDPLGSGNLNRFCVSP